MHSWGHHRATTMAKKSSPPNPIGGGWTAAKGVLLWCPDGEHSNMEFSGVHICSKLGASQTQKAVILTQMANSMVQTLLTYLLQPCTGLEQYTWTALDRTLPENRCFGTPDFTSFGEASQKPQAAS